AALARRIGFTQVSASHEVSPLIKLVPRGDTTVCDAYLSPVLGGYVGAVARATGGAPLMFMQSNGGLTPAAIFRGKDAVLSGPAGGVVGFAETARAAGFATVVGFDLGGTSTDVSHFAGHYERTLESVVAGVRLRAPMMNVHTVAAGGGSICRFDGIRFKVGPESAGADPGPACYRRGGPLTVTDCNVLLGKIIPERFPRTFGPGADQPLDRAAVAERFAEVRRAIAAVGGAVPSAEEIAEGFVSIAVDNMARAIRKISVEAGHDVRDAALAAFGGAAGQHACLVAEALGMARIVIHPLAGVLSAYGIGLARPRAVKEKSVRRPLDAAAMPEIDAVLADLKLRAVGEMPAPSLAIDVRERLHLRAAGADTALVVERAPIAAMIAAFNRLHLRQFGFVPGDQALICETAEVEAIGPADATVDQDSGPAAEQSPAAVPIAVQVFCRGAWRDAPCIDRGWLAAGACVDGPAIITDDHATTVVEPGWRVERRADGELVLTLVGDAPFRPAIDPAAPRDPVLLELFNNLFMSIAEQMGAVLQNTAQSVNVKERLDFSCAVFDAQANLVANAPHMPVHLGSMGDSVRAVVARHAGTLRAGDSYVVNAPYRGGTHLPDVTVVTPVFLDGAAAPAFFVAARGHHADIGGVTPGSMPPTSTSIDQEGIMFDGDLLVRDGVFREREIRARLAAGPFPARNPDLNVADLRAQCAATARGASELMSICARYGADAVAAYMAHVQDFGAEAVQRLLARLSDGAFTAAMDNGAQIAVQVRIDRIAHRAIVDFTGTSAQRPDNFNAPRSVCRAAVLYAFRCLIDEDIPLNDGCLRPIALIVPEGSLLDPRPPAAVVAGNVETSQVICDALFAALGQLAACQGTMNNFTFGDTDGQYYETVCGGSGAGPGFNGADAVQTHMTNSRLTDPEIIETRFPVLVERFAVRRGSGGRGRHNGGDGVERVIRFRRDMTAAILANRRATRPFGLCGGADAAPGETELIRADGTRRMLGATAAVRVESGDAIRIATPGGGGFGAD
ncbi:MAG: hydantoinase B/oxoprolinase family protein, partial [Rhodospirillaceae bacterium]|nr:hydantoinase B/oxoprolinase family protein [Rhodospirillaceae bacterium]